MAPTSRDSGSDHSPPTAFSRGSRLPAVSAIHESVDCAGRLHSEYAGQDAELADAPTPGNSKTVYPVGRPKVFSAEKKLLRRLGWGAY
jgi:hypothetical protein